MKDEQTTYEKIVNKDIEALYLGNLRTVEFDLDLPQKGKYGSTIQWTTKDERFITAEGRVTRPSYGKGDRIIELTAIFSLGDYQAKRVYEAKVLEEENDIVIASIYPVKLLKAKGQPFYLPQAVAVKTELGEILAHSVTWEGGEERSYEKPGTYEVNGTIKDTSYTLTAEIEIVEQVNNQSIRKKAAEAYPIHQVRLTGESMAKTAQDRRLAFLLKVDDDQMLYNFREAAGLDTKEAPEMIGWDLPDSLLKGHTTGHYLSALALCYGSTGNQQILTKLNYMIEELNKVQLAFERDDSYQYGFISGYSESQFDLLEEYVPYPQIWAPYYTLHKIFAGLLDSFQLAGLETALLMADKLGDWTYNRLSRLSHEQLKRMWGMYIAGEFGGMNEALAALYLLTKKPEHLKAAQLFDNDRLFFPMEQKVDALGALHANQHIPQIVGALKIYEASNTDRYYQIADFFWKSVTGAHIYSIGGTGDGEMFQQPNVIGQKIDAHTAETCASYNLLKLTKELYQYEPTADKMDYYERTLLNHILASTDHEELGGSTYFMPSEPGAQKGFDVENSCCHGTGLENHFKYGESIYYHSEELVFVNLFIHSRLSTDETQLELIYDETQPERVQLNIQKLTKGLAVRQPYWSRGFAEVRVNGIVESSSAENGYLLLSPKAGDCVEIRFKAAPRVEATPDVPEIQSLAYGPYILAAISDRTEYLPLNNSSRLEKKPGTLQFELNGQIYKPLAQINHEHYHLYMKGKSL